MVVTTAEEMSVMLAGAWISKKHNKLLLCVAALMALCWQLVESWFSFYFYNLTLSYLFKQPNMYTVFKDLKRDSSSSFLSDWIANIVILNYGKFFDIFLNLQNNLNLTLLAFPSDFNSLSLTLLENFRTAAIVCKIVW